MIMKENERLSALLAHAGVVADDMDRPCIFMIDEPDVMVYLEEDIDYTARLVPRSNIWLLYSKTLPERLIGVKIDGFDEAPTFKIRIKKRRRRIPRLADESNTVLPLGRKAPSGDSTGTVRYLQREKREVK